MTTGRSWSSHHSRDRFSSGLFQIGKTASLIIICFQMSENKSQEGSGPEVAPSPAHGDRELLVTSGFLWLCFSLFQSLFTEDKLIRSLWSDPP